MPAATGLTGVEAAVARDDVAAAVALLAELWRARPLPALAALLDAADARLARRELAKPAWFAAARAHQPADLGSVLASWRGDNMTDTASRLAALERWPRDGRIASWLATQLREVPFTSDASRPFWTGLFALVPVHGDARVIDAARALSTAIRPRMRAWIVDRLEPAVDALAARLAAEPATPLPAGDAARVAALLARLAPAAPDRPARDGASLLAQVYASPGDDGPRVAYGDWCSERDDPRGEFIALQLAAEPSPASAKRQAALLKAHGAAWLGPLAKHVTKDVVWRRGFPAAATSKLRREDLATAGHDPAWGALDELDLGNAVQWVGPAHANLRALRGVHLCVDALLAQTWPRLEVLDGSVGDRNGADRLVAAAAQLPALREFLVIVTPDLLVGAAFAGQLVRVATSDPVAVMAGGLERFGKLAELVHRASYFQELAFTRDGDGDLSIVRARLDEHFGTRELRPLPADLVTEIVFEPHVYRPRIDLAAMRAHLATWPRLRRADFTAVGGDVELRAPTTRARKPAEPLLPDVRELAQLAWTRDGTRLVGGTYQATALRVVDATTWQDTATIALPSPMQWMTGARGGGHAALYDQAGGVVLVDADAATIVARPDLRRRPAATAVAIDARGARFACGGYARPGVSVFDAGGLRVGWLPEVAGTRGLALSPDGARVAACDGTRVTIYDVATGAASELAAPPDGLAHLVVWIGDDRVLATCTTKLVMWSVDKPAASPVEVAKPGNRGTSGVAPSPDGRWLAIGLHDGGLAIVDVRAAAPKIAAIAVPDVSCPQQVAFSPDGSTIAAHARRDGQHGVVIVDAPSGRELRRNLRRSRY
jgi:uncharacterized protein (TIGR02996 family)|nr:TIGR02996 domain-containing protein [Kofleriaceae bacterium]